MIAMSPAESDVAPKTIGGTTSGVLSCKEKWKNENRLIISISDLSSGHGSITAKGKLVLSR